MKTFLDRCLLVIVLLCLPFLRVSTQPRNQPCMFPDFLERDKLWRRETEFRNSENMYFNGDRINIRETREGIQYERRCGEIINREEGIYFVHEHRGIGSNVMYLCMQFLKRSDSVVQVRESQPSLLKSMIGCSVQNMVLKNSPIIKYPLVDNPSVSCPFSGGYNLKIVYKKAQVCGSSVIQPRLESECEDGDGVTLDFRINECKLDDDHRLKEKLRCLASWTDKSAENNYTFVVLADNERFPVCMRLKGNLSDLKQANIFRDGKCVLNDRDSFSNTVENVELEFEKTVFSNLCENEFGYCTQELACSKYKKYCHKSCRQCHTETNVCSFPEFLKGAWHTDFKGASSVMNISTYNLHLPGEGNFKCVGKANSTEDNAYRLTLLHVFENGCFPRTTCFEYKKTSKMTLHYKFGRRVKWPVFPLDKMIVDTCQEELLKKPFSVAINEAQIYTTNCRLPGDFGFKSGHLYLRNSKAQDYCIAYNEYIGRSGKFNMVNINTTKPINKEHLCLSSEKLEDGGVFVITTSLFDRSYKCWGFIGKEQSRRIVQLSLEDCNEQTFKSLYNSNASLLDSFVVIKEQKNVCPFYIDVAPVVGNNHMHTQPVSNTPSPPGETTPFVYKTPKASGAKSASIDESGSCTNSAKFSLFLSSLFFILII